MTVSLILSIVEDEIKAERNKDGSRDYYIAALTRFYAGIVEHNELPDFLVDQLYNDLEVWTPVGVLYDTADADCLMNRLP